MVQDSSVSRIESVLSSGRDSSGTCFSDLAAHRIDRKGRQNLPVAVRFLYAIAEQP